MKALKVEKAEKLIEIENPMSPSEVLRMYLKEWAYEQFSSGVYVSKDNVAFIKQKMREHGNPDFKVTCAPYVLNNT